MAEELDDNFFSGEPSGIDETDDIFNDEELDDFDEIVIDNNNSPSNRPFILSLLGLFVVGLGAFLCLGIFNLVNVPSSPTPSAEMLTQEVEIAKIVQTNEAVATQNFYVTQTLEARDANAAATETAVANIPTETPIPTATPAPTNAPSPAADPASSEIESGESSETEGAEAPSIAPSERTTSENVDASSEESISDNNVDSTAADVSSSSASSPEQLPETGFSIVNTLALAIGLLILLFGARKMRQPQ
ncbi:MAG: LPXTG-motif cell wall-anchored protein [Cellvibrionaceae bacterium]|jgi:LPXTG-motif cell wall-anchored protein